MSNNILMQNKKSWEIVSRHFNGVDALPSYGPFTQTEDVNFNYLKIFILKKYSILAVEVDTLLLYMANREVSEIWGVDFSESQIAAAEETLKGLQPHLFCSPMEKDINLPKEYFDYVYSIYAIGWTTDLAATFNLIHSYLKVGGSFIFSWDHPLYAHLGSEDGKIYLKSSYQEEGMTTYETFKGEDAPMVIHKRKMSTFLNELIKANFTIHSVTESDVPLKYKDIEPEVSDRYYSLYKAKKLPTTMIIKAVKN